MRKVTTLLSTLALATTLAAQTLPQTERQYLSGHGCDDMVEWDFFCTDGRNSGKWTKIGVPSCWELLSVWNHLLWQSIPRRHRR